MRSSSSSREERNTIGTRERRRSSRQTSVPSSSGMRMSSTARSGGSRSKRPARGRHGRSARGALRLPLRTAAARGLRAAARHRRALRDPRLGHVSDAKSRLVRRGSRHSAGAALKWKGIAMHDDTRHPDEHPDPRRAQLPGARPQARGTTRLDRARGRVAGRADVRVLPLRGARSWRIHGADLRRDLFPTRLADDVRRIPLDPSLRFARPVVPVAAPAYGPNLRGEPAAALAGGLADALGGCARLLLADLAGAASRLRLLLAPGLKVLVAGAFHLRIGAGVDRLATVRARRRTFARAPRGRGASS